MYYEHFSEPILPYGKWLKRVYRSAWLGAVVSGAALLLGVVGYHTLGHLAWIDALLEASMILCVYGAVAPMTTVPVQLFASFYALMLGLVVVGAMAVILAPWVHRVLHYHLQKNPRKGS